MENKRTEIEQEQIRDRAGESEQENRAEAGDRSSSIEQQNRKKEMDQESRNSGIGQ